MKIVLIGYRDEGKSSIGKIASHAEKRQGMKRNAAYSFFLRCRQRCGNEDDNMAWLKKLCGGSDMGWELKRKESVIIIVIAAILTGLLLFTGGVKSAQAWDCVSACKNATSSSKCNGTCNKCPDIENPITGVDANCCATWRDNICVDQLVTRDFCTSAYQQCLNGNLPCCVVK